MKTIVFFGDSNTWGADPGNPGKRFAPDRRFTGIVRELLGNGYLVAEEGVCGRTTAFDDPIEPYRNGAAHIDCCMLTHMPVDLLVLMLGTNDLKRHLGQNPFSSAKGLELLIGRARQSEYGAGRKPPHILVVSPIHVAENTEETWAGEYIDGRGAKMSLALAGYYEEVARMHGCDFFDAALFSKASPLDGIHMDAGGHKKLADALADKIKKIFKKRS